VYGFPFRHKQGSREGVKATAVELTNVTDIDSKEELDTATTVDNICYERVPSKLGVSHQLLWVCVPVGPSIFHMSTQLKKAARGPCFCISYYQSDQIIQKTCWCILHSFTCLAHGKKIEMQVPFFIFRASKTHFISFKKT